MSPTGIFEEHAVFRNGVCIGQVPASDTADTCGWEKQKERHQNPGSGVVKGMKRLGKVALAVWFCIVFLAGCGEAKVPDVVTVPTVAVSKEGEVRVWQVGEFDKSYYNLAELGNMASQEAQDYNSAAGKEAVTVEKTESVEDGSGKVVVCYKFDNWESCSGFGENTLFYGTVKEAAVNGFHTDAAMKSVKDGSVLDAGFQGQSDGDYLLVTDIKADIYCPGKVAYISEGAVVNGDGSISSSEAEGFVYILLE